VSRTALVLVENQLHRDPRVLRQIDWLLGDGWTVDSVGLGPRPDRSGLRDHFELSRPPAWTRSTLGTIRLYLLSGRRRRFRVLGSDRVDAEVRARIAAGDYELVVFNDVHLLPWIKDPAIFTPAALSGHLHVDVHEYFPATVPRTSLWRAATARSWAWRRRLIGDDAFRTRSTVVEAIGRLYARELAIPPLTIIRNAPAYEEHAPSPVDPERVRLVYHGKADWDRGLGLLVDAMSLLDDRFQLILMLVGGDAVVRDLRRRAAAVDQRVVFRAPVPTDEISAAIGGYDLEVMFYPPLTPNLRFALPNKLFEAIQGRLGIVVGATEPMSELIAEYHNGVVVRSGWTARDLADALRELSADAIAGMKAASDRAARELNAEHEGRAFLAIVRDESTTSRP
jgi:glycosyltransferase involved in cell wall biosynthesis